MEYNFREIEKKWKREWEAKQVYRISNDSPKPPFYVLDMFPYPSGAGLHVGHPLGYIASDIFARFKRLKGFNVMHPMGYDAFGLPAEQYAIEHGIHPAVSTASNIKNFRSQLDKIGFCFDWDREVRTSDPAYYKWTQWIFLQLFKNWYNRKTRKAEPISNLIQLFEKEGNKSVMDQGGEYSKSTFSAENWNQFNEKQQQDILMEFRLAYCSYGEVNWCEALGTVLANDEVINGVSERGGYPVIKKKLRQWYLRITEYADRLLDGLEQIEFSESMKEMQSNWIGKSSGAEIDFSIKDSLAILKVYTTRPDTIFGVDFMVISPEHELVDKITNTTQQKAVEEYISYVKSRSERERMAEKKITGCFTGAFAINPFNDAQIPVWISEYVLAGYGTGAIMAVPCGDERDFKFAKHFNIPITNIIGDAFNGQEANATKEAVLSNSGFLNGVKMKAAIEVVIDKIEAQQIGKRKINYKMRDAAFSRQRYWGEPFPIRWLNGIAYPLDEKELPLELPKVENYKPGPEGEGPLANVTSWTSQHLETNTMPGYAGSSWYFLRYMDPHNEQEFCSRKASDYWGQVDLYIGGTEHAVGHLLYSRMWTKALYDFGYIGFDEPFKKLVNQGMIQGVSQLAYRNVTKENQLSTLRKYSDDIPTSRIGDRMLNHYYSADFRDDSFQQLQVHIPIQYVDANKLDVESFYKGALLDKDSIFYCKDGYFLDGQWYDTTHLATSPKQFLTISEVEKMSKRKFNTVDPDILVERYGADTFRMYEMFLGPVDQSKPWDTKGIEGVHRFLKKLWRLFFDELKGKIWNEEKATDAELKILHRTKPKKIEEDTDRFAFNTAVSAFMIAVNDLTDLKSHKKEILEPLLILLTPYAPHICEELYHQLNIQAPSEFVLDAHYPKLEEKYLVESSKKYPIAINGKTRVELSISLNATQQEVEEIVLNDDAVKKWLEGKSPRKIIYVKNKMINVVL